MLTTPLVRAICTTLLTAVLAIPARFALADTTVYIGNFSNAPGEIGNVEPISKEYQGIGQTFVSPGGTLTDFQLTVDRSSPFTGSTANFAIATFTNGTVGPLLYTGLYDIYPGPDDFYGLSVATTAGTSYVAFLNVAGDTSDPVKGLFLSDTGNHYAGGTEIYIDSTFANPDKFVAVSALSAGDLLFSAAFDQPASVAVTPEPSSLVLLGTGVLGVAGVLRRRRAANCS